MSEVVRLRLELAQLREGRRAVASILRDTRKSLELSKEEKQQKIASLQATQQDIREKEIATRARLERFGPLEARAKALLEQSRNGNLSQLGEGFSRAGAAISLGQGLGSAFSAGVTPQGALQATSAVGSFVGGIGGAVTAVVAQVTSIVVDQVTQLLEQRLAAFEVAQARQTEAALKTFTQRLREDPVFAEREARQAAQLQIQTNAALAQAGLSPAGRKLVEF